MDTTTAASRRARSTSPNGAVRCLVVALLLLAAVGLYEHFDLDQFFTLETLRTRRTEWRALYAQSPLRMLAGAFVFYLLVAVLNIPGGGILTLAAGAVFGLFTGTVLVSLASTLGATLSFLIARHLLHDKVQARWGDRLAEFNAGIERDGVWYLTALRLMPIPFFVPNMLASLTNMSAWRFFWSSQLGMLPVNIVYVNAGTQLGRLDQLSDVMSPTFVGSLALLGVMAMLARWMLRWQQRRVQRECPDDESDDRR